MEIVLDRSLQKAESTVLEYHTHFAPYSTLLTETRRAAFGRCENVDMAVEFENPRIPLKAWWCAWADHLDGGPVAEEQVSIRKRVIRQFVPYIEETVVGFRWEW